MAIGLPNSGLKNVFDDGSVVNSNDERGLASSDDNSSISIHDSDALRLDMPRTNPVHNSKRQLFYREEEESDFGAESHEPVPFAPSPIRKQVRFDKQRKLDRGSDEDSSDVHPWEFRRVIRKGFRDRLPKNYEIKRWKRPSRTMVNSVVQLLEANVESSLRQVLQKYKPELQAIEHTENVDRVFRQKQSIMNDIVAKIKGQLKKSKFPSRISDRELEIEYIVSKRKFIQDRYAEELANAERMERELLREQALLDELKASCESVKMNNRTSLAKGLIENNLHPSLNRAVENAYGLIADSSKSHLRGQDQYKRDQAELNLKSGDFAAVAPPDQNLIADLLPALSKSDEASAELYDSMKKFGNPELQKILRKLLPGSQGKGT